MRLVLLRHGRTSWNAEDRYQGRTDIPLDEVGQQQVLGAVERFAQVDFDLVLSSPLQHAVSTAEAMVVDRDVDVVLDDDLVETDGGVWEGLSFAEITDRWPEEYAAWRGSDPQAGPVDGEIPREAGGRVVSALARHLGDGDRPGDQAGTAPPSVLVVAHGSCLRAATAMLAGLGAERYPTLERLRNAEAIILDGDPQSPGQWSITGYNV